MQTALVHTHDGDVVASEKLHQHTQQRKKHLVAGVGLVVSIAVTVVALILAVLASDPLDAKLAERATATDVSIGTASVLTTVQQQRPESAQAIDAFLAWFEASGGVRHEHIGIADFPKMGKGIIATDAISEHEQLLFVPMNIVMCRETIAQAIPTSLQSKFKQLAVQEDGLLTAFLLLEMRNQEHSQWRPYLKLLPQYSPGQSASASPLFYTSEREVDALQDERMIAAARLERKLTQRAFKKFQRLFNSLWSNPAGSSNSAKVDLPLYSHTRFLVSSRAFTIKGQRYLVPFGDVFNGKPHESTRVFDNGQRFLQYHALKDNGVLIRADRSVMAKGGQVFEDYGDNNNYVYFLHHGFLMPDNQFDCASLRLPRVDEDNGMAEDVLELKRHVLSHYRVENGPLSCVMRDGRLSQESRELTTFYHTLLHMDTQAMRTTCGEKNNYEYCFLSTAGALLVNNNEDGNGGDAFARFMTRSIETQLKSYATSLNDDLELLQSGAMSQHERSAVTFRASRKQILHGALAKLQAEAATSDEHLESAVGGSSGDSNAADETLDVVDPTTRIERFEKWIAAQNLPINHLGLKFVSDAVGFGTFATKTLQRGEVYLSVPVGEMVMNLQSATKSKSLRRLVQRLSVGTRGHRTVVDDTLLLVLHLLDEKFGPNRLNSLWRPYLDVLPSIEAVQQSSLLFDDDEVHMELLRASDLYSHAVGYRRRVRQSYLALVRAIQTDNSLAWITETRFKYATAILDSRSIWWSGQRHLVPLLDMVNCLDLGADHAAHRTDLDTSTSQNHGPVAVTKASWDFAAGEQVVENYAQPNHIYLLFHGFVLEHGRNKHDCAHFSLVTQDRESMDNLPQPRRRVLMELIEALELKTWSPELCIDVASEKSVTRFAKVAFITQRPLQALEAFERNPAVDMKVTNPQVQAGLAVVASRLQALKRGLQSDGDAEDQNKDRPRQVILQYLTQQHEHMTSLEDKLQVLLQPSQGA